MKLLDAAVSAIYLEDEGRLIGRLYLPEVLREKMGHAPMLVVEQTLEQRVDVVIEDYVLDLGSRYAALHGEDGAQQHSEKLQQDLLRIRKRLGGERHQQVSALMAEAFQRQWQDGDLACTGSGWLFCWKTITTPCTTTSCPSARASNCFTVTAMQ